MKQCFVLNLNCNCDEFNMESISIHFHWDCARFRSEDIIVFVKVAMCIILLIFKKQIINLISSNFRMQHINMLLLKLRSSVQLLL